MRNYLMTMLFLPAAIFFAITSCGREPAYTNECMFTDKAEHDSYSAEPGHSDAYAGYSGNKENTPDDDLHIEFFRDTEETVQIHPDMPFFTFRRVYTGCDDNRNDVNVSVFVYDAEDNFIQKLFHADASLSGSLMFADFNFDGWLDVAVLRYFGRVAANFFLWDEDLQLFVENQRLNDMHLGGDVIIDEAAGRLMFNVDEGGFRTTAHYDYINGEFVYAVRDFETHNKWPTLSRLERTDIATGEVTIKLGVYDWNSWELFLDEDLVFHGVGYFYDYLFIMGANEDLLNAFNRIYEIGEYKPGGTDVLIWRRQDAWSLRDFEVIKIDALNCDICYVDYCFVTGKTELSLNFMLPDVGVLFRNHARPGAWSDWVISFTVGNNRQRRYVGIIYDLPGQPARLSELTRWRL